MITRYSRYSSRVAALAEKFNRSFKNLPKKSSFETGNGNWIDEINSFIKIYNTTIHSTILNDTNQDIFKKE